MKMLNKKNNVQKLYTYIKKKKQNCKICANCEIFIYIHVVPTCILF